MQLITEHEASIDPSAKFGMICPCLLFTTILLTYKINFAMPMFRESLAVGLVYSSILYGVP
jgi:hypothetical protein